MAEPRLLTRPARSGQVAEHKLHVRPECRFGCRFLATLWYNSQAWLGSAPSTPLKLTGEEVCVVLGEIWNVTVARTPSAMTVLSKPATKQRASPGATTLHEVSLPAASAAAPVVKKFVPAGVSSPGE